MATLRRPRSTDVDGTRPRAYISDTCPREVVS